MSDLADCAHTSQASITGIVDRLEEHGLVERSRPDDDRRVVQVAVTAKGREALASAHTALVSRLEEVVSPLTDEEQAEFLRLLRKLTSQ